MNENVFNRALQYVDLSYVEEYKTNTETRNKRPAAARRRSCRALALAACVALAVLLGLQPMVRYFSRNNGVGILPGESGAEQETQAETENGGNPYVPFAISSGAPETNNVPNGIGKEQPSEMVVAGTLSYYSDVTDVEVDVRMGSLGYRQKSRFIKEYPGRYYNYFGVRDAAAYEMDFDSMMEEAEEDKTAREDRVIFKSVSRDKGIVINGISGKPYGKYFFEVDDSLEITTYKLLPVPDYLSKWYPGQEEAYFPVPKDVSEWHRENVEMDFSNLKDGTSGEIGISFYTLGGGVSGSGKKLYYYKGINGVGLSFVSIDEAVQNYNDATQNAEYGESQNYEWEKSNGILPGESGAEQETQAESAAEQNGAFEISAGFADDSNGKELPPQRLAIKVLSFYQDVSDVVVKAWVGDFYSRNVERGRSPNYETYEKNGYPLLKVRDVFYDKIYCPVFPPEGKENSRLIINGAEGGNFEKRFSKEEMTLLDIADYHNNEEPLQWHCETIHLDFSDVAVGEYGEIKVSFGWFYENGIDVPTSLSQSEPPFFSGRSISFLYYRGKVGIGLALDSWDAKDNYVSALEQREQAGWEEEAGFDNTFCCMKPFCLTPVDRLHEVYSHGETIRGCYRLESNADAVKIKVNISASEGAEISAGYAFV